MRTIETIANITSDGKLTLQLPADVLPGTHRVVLVIEEAPVQTVQQTTAVQLSETEVGDAWDVLKAHAGSVEMPEDWAIEHDHYLYGTPKRYSSGTAE